jgi:hypothetical protein
MTDVATRTQEALCRLLRSRAIGAAAVHNDRRCCGSQLSTDITKGRCARGAGGGPLMHARALRRYRRAEAERRGAIALRRRRY